MHGGATPSGIASPHFRTGRRSKDLPTRLTERYQEALHDPGLLNLRDDIALLDTRIAELLLRVDQGESGAAWKRLTTTWRDLESAHTKHDTSGMAGALTTLGAIIRGGSSDTDAWAEVVTLVEQRRRLVEAEAKRLQAMQQMISVQDAMVFVTAVQDAVKRHVRDPAALQAIAADMRDLAHHKRPYGA